MLLIYFLTCCCICKIYPHCGLLMDFYCHIMLWMLQYSLIDLLFPTELRVFHLHRLVAYSCIPFWELPLAKVTLCLRGILRANWVRQGYSLQANSPPLGTTLDNSFRDNPSSGAPWALPEALPAPSLNQFLPILTSASFTYFQVFLLWPLPRKLPACWSLGLLSCFQRNEFKTGWYFLSDG